MATQEKALRVLLQVWNKWIDERLGYVASGLAFTTAFAVVPLLVVWAGLFGGFKDQMTNITEYFLSTMLPVELVKDVESQLNIAKLVENAVALSTLSVVFLIGAGIWLFYNIEDAFNRIFHVRRLRGVWERMSSFWLVLTFAPVLVGMNLYVTALIHNNPIYKNYEQLVFRFVPPLLTWLACWLAFTLIPNTKVDRKYAALGALGTAIAWEIEKWLFNVWMGWSQNLYNQLYASIVAIPFVLIWIQLSWMTVLLGLVFVYVMQYPCGSAGNYVSSIRVPYFSFHLLGILVLVNRRFQKGEGSTPFHLFGEELNLNEEYAHVLIHWLVEHKYLISTTGLHGESYVPAKPPETIEIAQVLISSQPDLWQAEPSAEASLREQLSGMLKALENCLRQEIDPKTLDVLLEKISSNGISESDVSAQNVSPLRTETLG